MPSTTACVSGHRLGILVRRRGVRELRWLRLAVDGRPVGTIRGRALRTVIEMRLPSNRLNTVRVVGLTRSGRKLTARYSYRACSHAPTLLPARPGG
jgi:hypothetical protein